MYHFCALPILSASTGISERANRPAGFAILPLLTAFSAPAGLYRQLSRQSMNLLVLPFMPFSDFSARVGLQRQLVRQSLNLPDVEPLQVYTPISPSANDPTGLTVLPSFTNLSAPKDVYRQLPRKSMNLTYSPFYHFKRY